jgi:uncharacterized protein (TIGR02611 family)
LAFRFQQPEESQVRDVSAENNSSETPREEAPEERQTPESSRLGRLLAGVRSTRAGRTTFRIGIASLGAVIIAIGIVLLPLPGPGWLIIFAGLAIWSIEFQWARRLRGFTQRNVMAWTTWYTAQGWLVRIVVGLATLLVVAAIVLLSARISFGPGVFDRIGSIF